MKTIENLQLMKKMKSSPFDNAYEYFILTLEDYYLAKIDGLKRIYDCLQEWDFVSRDFIINDLINRIYKSGIEDFDEIEFRKKLLE